MFVAKHWPDSLHTIPFVRKRSKASLHNLGLNANIALEAVCLHYPSWDDDWFCQKWWNWIQTDQFFETEWEVCYKMFVEKGGNHKMWCHDKSLHYSTSWYTDQLCASFCSLCSQCLDLSTPLWYSTLSVWCSSTGEWLGWMYASGWGCVSSVWWKFSTSTAIAELPTWLATSDREPQFGMCCNVFRNCPRGKAGETEWNDWQ